MKTFYIFETISNRWYVEAETKEDAINDYDLEKDNAYLDKLLDREVVLVEEVV